MQGHLGLTIFRIFKGTQIQQVVGSTGVLTFIEYNLEIIVIPFPFKEINI
jgi:hypothetical protein